MTNISSTSVGKNPPRRRRWPRRLLVFLLVFIGLPAGYYLYATWSLNADVARAIAETDELDPRWRLEDIEADRKVYPDEDNSALHAIKVIRLIGRTNPRIPRAHKHYDDLFSELSSAIQLNLEQMEILREVFEAVPDALVEARKLKDMPNGRFALTLTADRFGFSSQDQADLSCIGDLLEHDAMLRAQLGDPDAALESALAILNAARALQDEPVIFSIRMRSHCDWMLVKSVERTLAQGFPNAALMSELQNRLRQERNDFRALWITAVRGERAMYHRFLEAIRQRKIRLGQYMASSWKVRTTLQERLSDYLPGLATKNYPEHLRHRNELVAAAQLPLEQQLDRITALASKVDRSDKRLAEIAELIPLLPPDLTRTCSIHLWSQ